jgi:hypothetical protein
MVELRIEVVEGSSARALVRRLTDVFDQGSVSFDRATQEVRVQSEWESRSVTCIVDTLEAWLSSDGGAGSAKVTLGPLSYTVVAPQRATSDD